MAKRFSCKLWLALALFFWMQFSFFSQSAWGQVDSVPEQNWDVSAVVLAIFTPDQNFALPVAYINYKRWHLEPRYNYEDLHTFSTFVGYNFRGGERIRYLLTPMLGGVVGRTKGVAPGLEVDVSLGRFGFYTEMEYLFDAEASSDSYFYAWSQLRFAVKRWLIVSLVGGRNRVYQNDVEVQRGVALGFVFGKNSITGYYYNPFTPDNYGSVAYFRRL